MSAPARSVPVHVERESVNDESVIVLRVDVGHGEPVEAGAVVMVIETSKTTIEVTAPESGYLHLAVSAEDEVPIGALLFEILDAPRESLPEAEATPTKDAAGNGDSTAGPEPRAVDSGARPTAPEGVPALLSRPAEARARALGVPLARFAGQGWVTVQDVESIAGVGQAPSTPSVQSAEPSRKASLAASASPPRGAGPHRLERLSKRKRTEAERLTVYGNRFPQSTVGLTVELPGPRLVSPPFLFRESIADLVVYEASRLLRSYPELNGFYFDARQRGLYEHVNFGISFDSGSNLKVLAIEDSDQIGLPDLQQRYESLLERYESGEPLPAAVLEGATVTLSDLSRTAADYMLPLINGHQSLMLGMTRSGSQGYSLYATFDHRLAEGFRVVRFLEALRERLQSHHRDQDGTARISCHLCERSIQQELAHGGPGLVNIKLANGADVPICRNCFEGW